jgi:plastocyanin
MTPDLRPSRALRLVPVARAAVALAVTAAALAGLAGAVLADSPAPSASSLPASPAQAGSGAPAGSSGAAISIIQKTFQPADLTIQVGQTVTWTVTQAIADPHSVTSGSPTDSKPGTVFDSGINLRNDGDSFSHTFDTAGTFAYFCAVHPATMHGTITVQAAAGGGEAAPADSSGKLITAVVLLVVIVLLLGWARIYRRMNPA